ncbi:MAG: hypothetical protein JWM46_208 [Candidatus Kaiserbacteria bacterium]|nr:hypothetical protein [Candidatus Kaiserbacteria bacterium]
MYDALGAAYLSDIEKALPPEIGAFVRSLPAHSSILDVGCAGGRDTEQFLKYGLRPIGIDLSAVFLAEAKRRLPSVPFYKMDVQKMDFPDGTFGAIWAQAVLLHINREQVPYVLKEFYRVLRQDGKLHIQVKEGEGYQELSDDLAASGEIKRGFTLFGQSELEELVRIAGFVLISSEIVPDTLGRDIQWIRIWARKV